MAARILANSSNLSGSGITAFTASWAQNLSAHPASRGIFSSSMIFTPQVFSVTFSHPRKHPKAMSTYPMSSPPKNPFPLLSLPNASSSSFSPAITCPTASTLASSVCAFDNAAPDGFNCDAARITEGAV
ncbi:hypothetical protein OPV22_008917 [Ensete ventricosum]|uniref:Uncharacterized protein n=1 Tax=Ensete ventricosum TaxID=4639 RepID=A0AAV8PXZ2_ENSVE|nr:hypothetical protein OPV22_008917 [Ensete ventricosum]